MPDKHQLCWPGHCQTQQGHSLGARCAIEDDWKGVIAGTDRLVTKWTQNQGKFLLVRPIFMLEMNHVCRRQMRMGVL